MNDRVITAAGMLLALVVMLALVYSPGRQLPLSKPTSAEAGANGYLGLKRWLDYEAVPNMSLRRRPMSLETSDTVGSTGNIMLLTLPLTTPLKTVEFAWLESWVRTGNVLLVMAALNDSPAWALSAAASLPDDLKKLTGLDFMPLADTTDVPLKIGGIMQETPLQIEPVQAHPLMTGLDTLRAIADFPGASWKPELSDDSPFFARLALEPDSGSPAILQMPMGNGQLLLVTSSTLLSNRVLADGGSNAEFLSRLVAQHLAQRGVFIFDDFHHGLSDIYDREAFYDDPRLHATMGFIFAFWLIYMVGTSGRLHRADDAVLPPPQADAVKSYGAFMSRKLSRTDAGQMLVDGWLRDLQSSGRLQGGDPWEQLARIPLIPRAKLDRLQRDYQKLGKGRKVSLKDLHNQLLDLKRTLE